MSPVLKIKNINLKVSKNEVLSYTFLKYAKKEYLDSTFYGPFSGWYNLIG